MKFQVPKKNIVEAIDKLFEVATKGIKADFKLASRVRIEAKNNELLLYATNGHLNAVAKIEPQSVAEEGSAIVDAGAAREILRTIGGRASEDHILSVELKDQSLAIKDVSASKVKMAKLSTLSQDQDFTIKVKGKNSYTLPANKLSSSLFSIWKYRNPEQYEPKYCMVCLHFLPQETRYVCGDGIRFVVLSHKNTTPMAVSDVDAGDKWIIPADQAAIIANVISGSGDANVTLTFADAKSCFVEIGDNLSLHLRGIPEVNYPLYDNHAYRFDVAQTVVDVDRAELLDALALVKSVRDKDAEKQESAFHSCDFHVADGQLCLEVPKGKYQCKVECNAGIYQEEAQPFDSCYAWLFLNEVVSASNHEYIRFFGANPLGVMLVQPLDLVSTDGQYETDSRVEVKCPTFVDTDDKPNIIFFFSAATEEADED